MRILLFVLLLIFAKGDAQDCSDEIACQDYNSAVRCGKVEKCVATVWSIPTVQDDPVCTLCKDEINVLQQWLQSQPVESDVKAALLSFCNGVPFTAFKQQCISNVNNNFQEIYTNLTNYVSADVICSGLKACSGISKDVYVRGLMKNVPRLLKKAMKAHKLPVQAPFDPSPNCELSTKGACYDLSSAKLCNSIRACKSIWSLPVISDTICDDCMNGIKELQKKVNSTRDTARTDLINLCNRIKNQKIHDYCLNAVKYDLDIAYDTILKLMTPGAVCAAIRLCSVTEDQKFVKVAVAECTECETFIDDVQNLIFNNKNVLEAVLDLAKPRCDALNEGALCDLVAYQMMTEHMIDPANPKTICQKTNMCSAYHGQRVGDVCTDCKTFFTEFKQEIKDNPDLVSEVVAQASQFYCLQKPEMMRDQCIKYVTMVINVMLETLEAEDVGRICTKIQLCDTDADKVSSFIKFAGKVSKLMIESIPKHTLGGEPCADCKAFMTDLQTAIKTNETCVTELITLLESQCSTMGDLSSLCKDYVKDNYEKVLEQFAASDVDTMCSSLRMCGTSKNLVTGDICADCKSFFGDWKYLIANNKSLVDKDLDDAKNAICSQVPFFLTGTCDDIFDKDSGKIISAISAQTPEATCDDLYFCPAQKPAVQETVVEGKLKIPVGCEVCEAVMRYVDKLINYTSTEADIRNALDSACKYLHKYDQQCEAFVNKYVDEIVKLILEEGTSPLVVCTALRLCSPLVVVENDIGCEFCEAFVRYIDTKIDSNSTEDQIIKVLDEACDKLGQKYSYTCKAYVDAYGREIIDLIIKEGTNPSLVCREVQLCAQKHQELENGPFCDICTRISGELDTMLNDSSTQADIENALESVCGRLPSAFKTACDNFITDNFQNIVDELVKEMNPKVICVQLHFCSAVKIPELKQIEDGPFCDICTRISSELDSMLNDSSTQADIENALESVCGRLPSAFKTACDNFITDNFQNIVDELVKEMNPKVICVQLHFCSALKISERKQMEDGPFCDICTRISSELDAMLNDSSTQADVENALESVCGRLPSAFKTACDNFITDNFQNIVDELVKEMNPKVICVQLHFCSAVKAPELKELEDGPFCDICTRISGELDTMLNDSSTQADIENALESVCGRLPSAFKTACDKFITDNFQNIVDELVKEMNPKVICVQLHFCSAMKIPESKEPTSGVLCDVCTMISTKLDTMLNDSATQAEIEAALESVCNHLPSDFKLTCDNLVTQNFQSIVKFLVDEMKPSVICVQLKLCSALKIPKITSDQCEFCKYVAQALDDMMKDKHIQAELEQALEEICFFVPSTDKDMCEDFVKKADKTLVQLVIQELDPDVICSDMHVCPATNKAPSPDEECQVCQLIANELEVFLSDNLTETAIKKALLNVCYVLPSQYTSTCQGIIQKNYDNFMKTLLIELQPNVICTDLRLCKTKAVKVPEIMEKPKPKPTKSPIPCDVCQAVAKLLDDELSQNSTEAEIEKAVLLVCHAVPKKYQDDCRNLIQTYEPQLISLIVQELSPDVICKDLKLCASHSNKRNLKFFGECTICKVIMTALDGVLSDESVEKDILIAVNTVCNIVPKEYRQECLVYIRDYGPGVIQALIQDIVPGEVCQEIRACEAKLAPSPIKIHVNSNKECDVCRNVIQWVDEFLDQNYTEAAVEDALKRVCQEKLAVIERECDEMVDKYTPVIMQYIDKIGDPGFICQHLHLCPTDVKEPKLIGGDKCTYGPSYWCQTMDTAKECNAVVHCRNHVW